MKGQNSSMIYAMRQTGNQVSISGILKDCWNRLRLGLLSPLSMINNDFLFDPIFFHSAEKFAGNESLLGAGIIFLGEGCNGNILGWYP